jgi:hypothetical protein
MTTTSIRPDERGPTSPPAAGRARRGRILLVAGGLLISVAVIFRLAIVPSLLKLPTHLDVTAHFTGQQVVYLNPKTGAPLQTPERPPLNITRHITADKNASDSHRVVLDEAVTADVKGAPQVRQRNRYVMDRKSAVNVADPRSYAFVPANKVNRSGRYRLAFGFDVPEGKPIKLYSNDTDSTYQALPDRHNPAGDVDGNRALNYDVHQSPHAVSPVYLAGLEQAVGLPAKTTLAELGRGLGRAGVNLSAVFAALPAGDQARIARLQQKPIPLLYEESVRGKIAIEPKTGSLADVFNERITVTVRPNPTALAPVVAILNRNEGVAAVRSSLPKLQAAATHAQPVFALDYHQTPASVADIGHDISSATVDPGCAGPGTAGATRAPSPTRRVAAAVYHERERAMKTRRAPRLAAERGGRVSGSEISYAAKAKLRERFAARQLTKAAR